MAKPPGPSMIAAMTKILDFFFKGHERSVRAKKNIFFAFLLRGISVVVSFVQVPITLHYLSKEKYGIWLTLSSILGWFYILDIGLGNGLRNKFAEAMARREKKTARIYVSTTYAMLAIIIFSFFLLFLLINPFLNWVRILNTSSAMQAELNELVFLVVACFCLQFILKLVGTLLTADQKPAVNDLLVVAGSAISLVVIYLLSKTTSGSLLYLGLAFAIIPLLVYLLANVIVFTGIYKEYRPTSKLVDLSHARELTSLGFKFFIIQIAGIVIYSTSNIIITQVLGPAEVTPYNIAYKYFNTATMFFMIVMTPFWSGFTEAYSKGDIDWIKLTMRKLNGLSLVFALLVVIMVLLSGFVYKFWVGNAVEVPFLTTLFMGLYVMILSWGAPFVFFINGVGKIRLQLIVSIVQAVLFFAFAMAFTTYFKLGVSGVIVAMCIPMIPTIVLWPLQYSRIINNKSARIWDK